MSTHTDKKNASLVVVGSGIKFISHLTTEARAYIEKSNRVLYLVNDPAMQDWIAKANPCAESLYNVYTKHPLRLECYRAITEYILKALRQIQHVCVVLYGHPTVFSQPALNAVQQARQEGYYAKILPGISAEDCLYADLLIDPSNCGCLSLEATELLIHKRRLDPASHLILWQVGVIGLLGHEINYDNKKGASALCEYLKDYYPESHEVVLYEAAQYPHLEPKIEKFSLSKLPDANFSPISTLYVSPTQQLSLDQAMLDKLNMAVIDLK
jgi:tetrapyrrole methylase family protein/MazG family protein